MGGILDDERNGDQPEEAPRGMTFDEMVAFTMFAEVSLVLGIAVVYLVLVYLAAG